eukprot:TRINITY_DN8082_c0_g1_i1.p1 TRINITY_DN8082_c0_g1~~TRINITY_DN8082_c0_g1_i1.p1  ORF type:complete len:1116 (+),score=222.87 TRINITY_DN8082_c0_g1_i1:22-3369(+)
MAEKSNNQSCHSIPSLIDFGDDSEKRGTWNSLPSGYASASQSFEFNPFGRHSTSGNGDYEDRLNYTILGEASPSFSQKQSFNDNTSPQSTLDLLSDVFNSNPSSAAKTETESCTDENFASYQTLGSNPFEAPTNQDSRSSGNPFESPLNLHDSRNISSSTPLAEEDWFPLEKLSISQENEGSSFEWPNGFGNRDVSKSYSESNSENKDDAGQYVQWRSGDDDWPDLNEFGFKDLQQTERPAATSAIEAPKFSVVEPNRKANEQKPENELFCNSNKLYLEEFVAPGGEKSIFKPPVREAIRPGRPAFLELRPHPLRETQDGQATFTIICTQRSLWAGLECGIAIWNFDDIPNDARFVNPLLGDEDSAPYVFLHLGDSPIICLLTDSVRGVVWSGHKDGYIRAWPLDASNNNVVPKLSWRAGDGPVLSMVVTSLGDLWMGSETGTIRAWNKKVVDHSLSSYMTDSSNAVLKLQTCTIDLRDQMGPGSSSYLNYDVKFLASDDKQERVWSAGASSLTLWDARTKELIKSLGSDGQIEFSRTNVMLEQYTSWDDNYKPKISRISSKEKAQGALSFFQRSKNALMGAADAVCRVTIGSQLLDDGRKIKSMAVSVDGSLWTGHANGLLVKWNSQGQRISELQNNSVAVLCLFPIGMELWVAYDDGRVHVMQQSQILKAWLAHDAGVIQMAAGRDHVFTLAAHGGIRGWHRNSPSSLDKNIRPKLIEMEPTYTKEEHVKIFASTWNVSQERASLESLRVWLSSPGPEAGIVVIGLQEMEMGAGVLAMAAARETVGIEGSANGNWWLDNISYALDKTTFALVGSRQLAGLLIGAWVKKELLPYVGDVDVGAVACGFGRTLGNKGAVAIRMKVFRKTICVVNCHLAAHTEGLTRRNADFDYIYRSMTFSRSLVGVSAGVSSAVQTFLGSTVRKSQNLELEGSDYSPSRVSGRITSEEELPQLTEADMAIWLGDFNYRLNNISYDDAIDCIKKMKLQYLLQYDQLRSEMSAGRVFQGMHEGFINFPPTYKFDRGIYDPHAYDSSEKKRVPAWCDRILFRDSRNGKSTKCSLSCPVLSFIEWYDSCMNVVDSDHKPVMCMFNVFIAFIDESARRRLYWDLYNKLHK